MLLGKTIVITGTSSGIGARIGNALQLQDARIAERFEAQGFHDGLLRARSAPRSSVRSSQLANTMKYAGDCGASAVTAFGVASSIRSGTGGLIIK